MNDTLIILCSVCRDRYVHAVSSMSSSLQGMLTAVNTLIDSVWAKIGIWSTQELPERVSFYGVVFSPFVFFFFQGLFRKTRN